MRLDELNALTDERAVEAFTTCCGSAQWAHAMMARRPFATVEQVMADADRVFESLDGSGWLEAFAAHPRIGDRAGRPGGTSAGWSAEEQSGVTEAARGMFAQRNRAYEARFGHTFIVCATGRSADEMLQILERRMLNNPDGELRQAAAEQRQITRLRLGRLLT
jgi:2-oxo-4-hydroxy-4-carboxy-5-ureidoimidazoline decarboxylase